MQIRPLIFAACAVAAVGCKDPNAPTFVNNGAQAYVRYINASPDSPSLTVRLVDKVENWRTADGLAFRGNSGYYVGVNAGTRQLRAFRNLSVNSLLDTGTVTVLDTTLALQPQTYYTIVQTGTVLPARGQAGNTARVTVFTDTVPNAADIAAGTIRVRVYNTATSVGAVDVAAADTTTGSTATGAIANVAPLTRSAYVSMPALGATGFYRFTVRAAGGTAALGTGLPTNFPGLTATAASATSPQLEAVAGVRLAKSALALVVFPAAVPGSPAASAATASPTVDLFPDNKP